MIYDSVNVALKSLIIQELTMAVRYDSNTIINAYQSGRCFKINR